MVAAAAAQLDLPERVIRADYVPEEELWSLLAACDVVVSLRWPTMGETSAAAVRALSLGKPLVVTDVGAFRELPDDVAIKVPAGEGEVDALVAAIDRAASSPEMGARGARARPGRARRSTTPPISTRRPCARRPWRSLHEGRLLLADAALAVGDRRLLGAPPARAGEAGRRGRRQARALRRAPAADVALYHVGNDAEAHGWIVEALRRRPGVVVLHDFVLHHLVVGLTFSRGDAAGYLAAMEREGGLVGRLLAYAVLDNKLPPLWETRPEDFPLAGEVLEHATGLIVHSHYVEQRARETGYSGPIVRIPHPAWPVPELAAGGVEGDPLYGCFGHLNDSKRIAELVAAFSRLRERRPGARLLLVGVARRAARPRSSSPGRRAPRLRPRGRALVADGRLRRDRLPALADDGRDLRQRDPGALARASRSSSATSAGSRSSPTTPC